MSGVFFGLVMTGLAVYVAIVAVAPTVSYFTKPAAWFNHQSLLLMNSTCDVAISFSRSELLGYLKFASGTGINSNLARHLLPETLSVHPQTLYRILKRFGVPQWPPDDSFTVNATAAELLTLLGQLTSPMGQVRNDCHSDASYDPVNRCCFISCPTWKWPTRAEEIADDVMFYVTLTLSGIAVFVSTTTVFVVKTKRRFPLIMIAWYICLATSTLNIAELVGRVMGENNLVCCGVKDLAESMLSNCIFAIVYVILHHFFSLAVPMWCILAAANVAIIEFPQLAHSFFAHLNCIHAIESLIGWGLPGVLAILPYALKGKDAYRNVVSVCPTCFWREPEMEYFTLLLPVQIFLVLLGLLIGFLALTVEKKLKARKKLMGEATEMSRNVQDLQAIRRRLLQIACVIFAAGLCFAAYISLMIANTGRVEDKVSEYVECVVVNSGEETCVHGAYTHYATMIYLILNRVEDAVIFIGSLRFFFVTRDSKNFWKKAFRSCSVRGHCLTAHPSTAERTSAEVKAAAVNGSGRSNLDNEKK